MVILLLDAWHPELGHNNIVRRDGNGYPKPETRWVFTLLGAGFGSNYKPTGFLMGKNQNPSGLAGAGLFL